MKRIWPICTRWAWDSKLFGHIMFDDVHDPDSSDPSMRNQEAEVARQAGIEKLRK
jgi:hypothetical protein